MKTNFKSGDILISPLNTVTGSGGTAHIYYAAGYLHWSVKPKTDWPYHFSGEVKFIYDSGHKPRIYYVGGYGAFGSTTSDLINVSHTKGAEVHFSGTAYALNGSEFIVLPKCETHYKK